MSSSKTFSFKKNSKKAFTLIELSIVLIIIGLLIVAITSGSSLIRNAKLRSITNEAKQYQVAVNSFFMKFDEYPGDFNQLLPDVSSATGGGAETITVGHNNDIIEWVSYDASATPASVNEGSNAWLQLVASAILPSDITSNMAVDESTTTGMINNSTDITLVPTTHFPTSAENAAGWIFNSNIQSGITTNYVQLVKSFQSQFDDGTAASVSRPLIDGLATGGGGALTPSDAFSIDNKNDDGLRNSGDVREVFAMTLADVDVSNATVPATGDCDASETATVNGQYDLDNGTENICSLAFKVTIN
jgi:prepilin-type N-terminal cleavage/methylation domain-containing protein